MKGEAREIVNGGRNNMPSFRLTNLTHSEVAHCLPLPKLPHAFGASNPEIFLFDEGESDAKLQVRNDAAVLSEAGKIAELLRQTDVSYLSLRDEAKSTTQGVFSEPGSLLEAVLHHDSGAFSCSAPDSSRRVLRNSFDKKQSPRPVVLPREGNWTKLPAPTAADDKVKDTHASGGRAGIKRKDTSRLIKAHEKEFINPARFDQKLIVGEFSEMLDEFFERMYSGDDEGEEAGTLMSLAEMRTLAEDVVNLRAKNALHAVPVDLLTKLLTLLDHHVKCAHEKDVEDGDDVESESFSVVMSALEAVQITLTIMTAHGMPKQVYKEEIIDRAIDFLRYQIIHSVFTAYDPVYRQLHKRSGADFEEDEDDDEEDLGENGGVASKKNRRKSKACKTKKAVSNKVPGSVSNVLHKICSILALLKDLLAIERLLDSSVLQLTKTIVATFVVDNIQLLQLKAIGVACIVFDLYPQHRIAILDEIIALLWKLSSSKRNLRMYQLQYEDSKHIQMLTALLLQLVQCSVSLPNAGALTVDGQAKSKKVENSSMDTKCFEPAREVCTYFWTAVLPRWAAPKSNDGADVKGIVENFVVDLLTTLNIPEFPAASLLLQVLCILLCGQGGMKAKDAMVRGTAIDLLGQIAARLKLDAFGCSRDQLWILQELQLKGGAEIDADIAKKTCVICAKGKGSQVIFPCDGCNRWFHGDCVGVARHDMRSRGWLCHYCLCKRQLSFLSPVANNPPKDNSDATESLKESVVVVEQILLNYLQEAAVTDSASTYAHRFYLCQWFRDDVQCLENLQFYHARSMLKVPLQDFGMAPTPLSRDVMLRLVSALGQQRALARSFDRILERLLASLQENSPTPRAKALRAVSAVVEADPSVLGDERVQRAVEGRFLDSAISVREAAMELVGRHIVCRPDFAAKYFEKIAERIMDTGVSVRKRVIKIIRDVCMSNVGFSKATDGCVRIISRINDEESSIQDLVGKTFYELWFEEPSVQSTHSAADGSLVPPEIAERTQQLVDVLRSLPNHHSLVTIIKRSLALDFCPHAVKNSATSSVTQAAVRHRCEMMCKCLIDSVLKVEESSSKDSEIRALPYILALHAFCTVDPNLCAPTSDPSRFAVTLKPYLKTQVDSRDAAQLLQSIVYVIDTVLPLLRRPSQSFVEELERDLKQLIVRYSYLSVVHACIKCLCSLSKVAVKGVTSLGFLVHQFFKHLDSWRKGHYLPAEKPKVLRYLFCLSLLARYGAELIDGMQEYDVTMNHIFTLYKHYLQSEDHDIKAGALQAVGFMFIARPEFMMEKEIGKVLEVCLSASSQPRLKLQMLRNFSDYLHDVEERMGTDESGAEKKAIGSAVPVAAGAGDSNICGGIIQLHWDQILEGCLDMMPQVRQSALKVVEVVLRQGLVHPMTCIPQLIALEVDQHEANSKLAHRLLMQMNEKYPSFLDNRIGEGLQLSFLFIQSGAASATVDSCPIKVSGNLKVEQNMAKFAKAGISRMYKLIRSGRGARNKFLFSVIKKFDSGASGSPSSIKFLLYCSELISSLPFGLPDEPLYIVYNINRVVQVRGGSLEANIKAAISKEPLEFIAKQVLGIMAVEKEQASQEAYDVTVTDETASRKYIEVADDTQGIPIEALKKLREDCNDAMAMALLLRLKRHLKIVYSLNDARCQAFTPTESIKAGDVISRRETVKEFSTQELPMETPKTVRQMLEQYQAFKRLLKEDAMDYSTYTAITNTKKRGRAVAYHTEAMGEGPQPNGHIQVTRTLRRKSGPSIVDEVGSGSDEDRSDEEWGDTKSRKRKRGSGGSRNRSNKKVSL